MTAFSKEINRDRKSLSFPHQSMVDAIMRYGGWEKLPEAQK